MAVNGRTASSRQLAARSSTATCVLMSASSIRRRLLHHESRFNLWDHDGRISVRRYTGEFCLPEYVIEQHSDLIPGVMVWGTISYHGRSNLLRIQGNLNSNSHMQLLPWTAYSPDMSPIDLVGRRLARDPRSEASKDEL
ncbi:hypothetical protein TNCV_1161371 [Trichonephila clavipes]|nr:hypothetical protein TNCV_1161371 [Trichonephila clavipes]